MKRMFMEDVVIPEGYREPITQALMSVYERMIWDAREQFGLYDMPALTVEDLLKTPAAALLAEIARAADGQRAHSEVGDGELAEAIQGVCEWLFASPLWSRYDIPEMFWESALGSMIARAQLWLRVDEEWITPAEAAALAGVSKPAITQAMDDQRLTVQIDPDKSRQGRRLVRKEEVLRLWGHE